MTRLLLLLTVLTALPASAVPFRYLYATADQPGGCRNPCASNTCNGTMDFTTAGTEGMATSGLFAVRITVCAQPAQTLSGSGQLRVWTYLPDNPLGAGWSLSADSTITIPVTCGGQRCCTFNDRSVLVRLPHRVAVTATNVAISAAGTSCLNVLLDGQLETEVRR